MHVAALTRPDPAVDPCECLQVGIWNPFSRYGTATWAGMDLHADVAVDVACHVVALTRPDLVVDPTRPLFRRWSEILFIRGSECGRVHSRRVSTRNDPEAHVASCDWRIQLTYEQYDRDKGLNDEMPPHGLGYIMEASDAAKKVVPVKFEAVMNWQAPKSVGEIKKLYEAQILVLPEGTKDIVVYSDASYSGLGCVLTQRGKVIAYASSKARIKAAQVEALKEENWKSKRIASYIPHLEDDSQGIKTRHGRIYIPFRSHVKKLLLEEAHKSKYYIHLEAMKMYLDLKKNYWWPGMKRDCIPVWKWEKIMMDFVTKLPKMIEKHDAIWVIVDRLTKSAHFIPIRENIPIHKLAKIYVNEIVVRHGVPVSIVSDRDGRFTSNFWQDFQELGTKLHMSIAFYPKIDGQSERTIQMLEDMLRACVIDFGGNWDDHLPLVEFTYNNSYHTSIKMPQYEMLYGRRYRTPVCWEKVGSKELASTDVVLETTEKIKTIRERLKAAQDRWKSYADNRRRAIEFNNSVDSAEFCICGPNTAYSVLGPNMEEGHTKEECYKIVGYPVGHPLHGKYRPPSQTPRNNVHDINESMTVNIAMVQGTSVDVPVVGNLNDVAMNARMDQITTRELPMTASIIDSTSSNKNLKFLLLPFSL
ncbi:DNA/RNA polymerases superfamily protein [Tanacetum coccineum]